MVLVPKASILHRSRVAIADSVGVGVSTLRRWDVSGPSASYCYDGTFFNVLVAR